MTIPLIWLLFGSKFMESQGTVANSIGKLLEMDHMPEDELISWRFARARIEIQVLKTPTPR